MTLLEFTFRSIWHFAGVLILFGFALEAMVAIARVIFGRDHEPCELNDDDVIQIFADALAHNDARLARLRRE